MKDFKRFACRVEILKMAFNFCPESNGRFSDSPFPVKSATLRRSNHSISHCHDPDLSEGTWNMCISSIVCTDVTFSSQFEPRHIAVTCNFVTAVKWGDSGLQTYDQPLAMFLLEPGNKSIAIDKTWFRINNPSGSDLQLKLIDPQAEYNRGQAVHPQGKFSFFVLFQRVK